MRGACRGRRPGRRGAARRGAERGVGEGGPHILAALVGFDEAKALFVVPALDHAGALAAGRTSRALASWGALVEARHAGSRGARHHQRARLRRKRNASTRGEHVGRGWMGRARLVAIVGEPLFLPEALGAPAVFAGDGCACTCSAHRARASECVTLDQQRQQWALLLRAIFGASQAGAGGRGRACARDEAAAPVSDDAAAATKKKRA